MPTKCDPGGTGEIEGRIGKPRRRENIRAELEHGRRNKTRKLATSASLSPSLPSFFLLSFLPSLSRRLPLRTSHPIRFSSFHFYMDFFSRTRPFFLSFVESLAQTCCTSPPHFSSLSQSPSFFSFYFFFPSWVLQFSGFNVSSTSTPLKVVIIKVLMMLFLNCSLLLYRASLQNSLLRSLICHLFLKDIISINIVKMDRACFNANNTSVAKIR